jgi:O-antigen/teichoic acid export membrane protein
VNSQSGEQKRFGRDVFIATLAQLARTGRNVLLIPLITSNLSIAHYGEWEMLGTAIAFLTPWLTLGLAGALIRFLPGTSSEEIREGFYSIFFFISGSCVLIGGLLFSCNDLFDQYTPLASLQRNILAVIVVLVATILLGIVQTYYRAFRRMLAHSTLVLSQHFGEAVLLFYLIQGGAPLSSALWALAATRVGIMIVGLGGIVREIGIIWPRFDRLRTYISYSLPLMPNALFYRLYDSADRFFIFAFVGSDAVGKYAAIYLAGSLFTTIVSPIHTVLLPAMAELWNKGRQGEIALYMEQVIRFSALILIPSVMGVALLAEPLLGILIGEHASAEEKNYALICISFAVFSFGIPWGDLLAVAGKTRQLFILNGTLAGINILLNFLLIPDWGILGAVCSTLACHILFTIVSYSSIQNVLPFNIPWRQLLLCFVCSFFAVTSLYFIVIKLTIVLSLIISCAVYTFLLIILGVINKNDTQFFFSALGIKR